MRKRLNQDSIFNSDKIILSLCDYSGHWPSFYRKAGYDVQCFDLKKTGDVRLMLHTDEDLYGVLCAPPCTEFTVSGNQYWPAKDADGRTVTALSIVDACLRVVALHPELKFWSLENPVGRLNRWLGEFEFAFDPCDFAAHLVEHPDWTEMLDVRKRAAAGEKLTARDVEIVKNCNVYPKKTLLWGRFNHPRKCRVEPITVKASNGDKYSPINMATGGKSEKTKTIRSETPLGFAQAFYEANQ